MKQTQYLARYFLTVVIATFSLLIAACGSSEPEAAALQLPTEKTMYVAAEQVDCEGAGPQTCLQVRYSPDEDWQYFYDNIAGFEPEPGVEYELRVNEVTVDNPPADASSIRYELIETVKQQVVDESMRGGVADDSSALDAATDDTSNDNSGMVDADAVSPSDATTDSTHTEAGAPEQPIVGGEGTVNDTPNDNDDKPISGGEIVANPFENIVWTLVQYGTAAAPQRPVATATAEFVEGQVQGTTGCNRYFGSYDLSTERIAIGPLGMTEMACLDAGVMEQESAFLQALGSAENITVNDGSLTITYPGGELVFAVTATTPTVALEGTTWKLQSFASGDTMMSTVAGSEITLELNNGQLGGSAGCNRYFADYQIADGALKVGPVGATKRGCMEPLMQQEFSYLTALGAASGITLEGDRLTIAHPDGALIYVAQPDVPEPQLEGTLWKLQWTQMGDVMVSILSGTEITAQFADGQLSGSAGCNNYFTSYMLQGNILELGEIGMTRMACADDINKQEMTFINALGTASAFLIEEGRLTVTVADGALVFTSD